MINRLPSSKLNNKSPLEILYKRKIDISHLRTFGCMCFVKIKRKDKLDFNSIKTVFLGYSSQKKGYKCYDPINKKILISRDVIFWENESYFKREDSQESSYIDQLSPVLPQLYSLDSMEHKEIGVEETEGVEENLTILGVMNRMSSQDRCLM